MIENFPFIGAGLVIFLLGLLIFQNSGEPFDLMFGLPAILIGISLIVINLYELLAAVLDPQYSRTHCPLCQED